MYQTGHFREVRRCVAAGIVVDFIRKGLEVHEIGSVEPGNVGGFEFEILVVTLISEMFCFFCQPDIPQR